MSFLPESKKTALQEALKAYIGEREFSKNNSKINFRTGGVQAQNDLAGQSAGLTLRPDRPGIGASGVARPKIHYFPFVAREYLSDLAIRPLNLEERGLFLEYLCWMWESPVRGALFRPDFAPVSPEFRLRNVVVPLLACKTTPEADFERAQQLEQKLIETSLIRVGLGGVLYNKRLLFYTTEYELKLLSRKEFPEFQERILRVIPSIADVSPEFRRYFADVSPLKRPISINKAKEKLEIKENTGGRQETPTDFQAFTAWFFGEWERRFKTKPNWNGVDGKHLKTLLGRFGFAETQGRCLRYLTDPPWASQQNGLSFRDFFVNFDKLGSRGVEAEDTRFENLEAK